ncbi:MAG: MBL fold metallo-hydrolase [Armatimonadetes bacterium]|nr:MBL fold metallo-hydrolase [Armatimonadota bacterium]
MAKPIGDARTHAGPLRLTILYDNIALRPDLSADHGFACLVRTAHTTGLFDTGRQGDILLRNARGLGVDFRELDWIALSHAHHDHVGGLDEVLSGVERAQVILPAGFPASIKRRVLAAGKAVVEIEAPTEIAPGIWLTGPLPDGPTVEQALVAVQGNGQVLLTGCSHPGIVKIAESVMQQWPGPIQLVIGGMHLMDQSKTAVRQIVGRLQELCVERVAPLHCTGPAAQQLFADAYGQKYISGGVGTVLEL